LDALLFEAVLFEAVLFEAVLLAAVGGSPMTRNADSLKSCAGAEMGLTDSIERPILRLTQMCRGLRLGRALSLLSAWEFTQYHAHLPCLRAVLGGIRLSLTGPVANAWCAVLSQPM
jgi:hypothetical protein